ncbi:MAG: cytochrome c oxidase assembly protein [Acidimicrobiales bacterium]
MTAAATLAQVPVSPWSLHLHPVTWIVLLGATALYATAIRHPERTVHRRQAWAFLGGIAVLLVALTWPLADLAAHHLLVALVVQRMLLMLAAPPLLLSGLPATLVARATRPAAVDEAVRFCSRPVPAVLVVTAVAVTTLTTPAVDGQASSAAVRGALDAGLLGAGVVLWLPVLRSLPGAPRLMPLGRAAYLVAQSVVPSFLAIVWIFARHPLYPVYAHAGRTLGMSPLLDQQVSGFVAKLGTIAALWTVAFVIVSRSERHPEDDDGVPLTWADVQRHFERAERRARRRSALPLPPGWGGSGRGPGREEGDRDLGGRDLRGIAPGSPGTPGAPGVPGPLEEPGPD